MIVLFAYLAVGMLVDDAIIVVEFAERLHQACRANRRSSLRPSAWRASLPP